MAIPPLKPDDGRLIFEVLDSGHSIDLSSDSDSQLASTPIRHSRFRFVHCFGVAAAAAFKVEDPAITRGIYLRTKDAYTHGAREESNWSGYCLGALSCKSLVNVAQSNQFDMLSTLATQRILCQNSIGAL